MKKILAIFLILLALIGGLPNVMEKGIMSTDGMLVIVFLVIGGYLVIEPMMEVILLDKEEREKRKNDRIKQKQEKARIKEEKRIKKQKEYEEKVEKLKKECQFLSSIDKVYKIKESEVYPYYWMATKILRKKNNINLRIKKSNELIEAGLLNKDDLDNLMPIFKQEYNDYLEQVRIQEEVNRIKREQNKQKRQELEQQKYDRQMSNPKKAYKINKKNGIVSCPKCGSTTITMTNKKLSVTRGVVGAGLLGPVGMLVGSTTSKKLYNVCMNCGHRWKP